MPDVDHAYDEALARGARGVGAPEELTDEHGTVRLATIATYGDTLHTFVDRVRLRRRRSCPGYARRRPPPSGAELLLAIDHIVGNVELGHMEEWVGFYERVFGMTEMIHFSDEAISTEYSALMSKVVTSGNGRIKFPINEPAEGQRKSQIDEYLDFYEGAGRAAHRGRHARHRRHGRASCAGSGVGFLTIPDAYYDDVAERVARGRRGSSPTCGEQGILVDHDDEGYLLQIFTQAGRRPADDLLRDHRAPRRPRLRRGELQGAVRGDRARAGPAGEPLMRYVQLGDVPAKRHVQFRDADGTAC